MNRELDERMWRAGLAHRRYPDMDLRMALECFSSDRSRAGLGALDARRRNHGGRISNRKEQDPRDGRVVYDLSINIPPRREYPRKKLGSPSEWTRAGAVSAAITAVEIPARTARKCLPVEWPLFGTQLGRGAVAKMLRELRRDMRSAP